MASLFSGLRFLNKIYNYLRCQINGIKLISYSIPPPAISLIEPSNNVTAQRTNPAIALPLDSSGADCTTATILIINPIDASGKVNQLRAPKQGKNPTTNSTTAKIPKIKLAVFILNKF